MDRNWLYIGFGCGPWIVAWLFYMLYSKFRRAGEEARDSQRDAAGNAARHLAWLAGLRADQENAEQVARTACANAEAAAAQLAEMDEQRLRRAAARAAAESETAAAAATAADISGRQLPEGRSTIADEFAERAARAAALLAARVSALPITTAADAAAEDGASQPPP
jgi:hypothetical protein